MRTLTRILLASSGAAIAGLAPSIAAAQNDVTPHLPNVLLLIDTSGSMEFLLQPDPTDPTGQTPMLPESPHAASLNAACTVTSAGVGAGTTTLNKWATLATVLTGTFQTGAFGCEAVPRNAAKFISEYTLPGTSAPYDLDYFLPWHRIYANGCTIGATQVPLGQDWTNWGNNPYDLHQSAGTCASSPANCCASGWSGQNNDGLLDIFSGLIRFGMMTFDTFPDPSTGSTPATVTDVNGPSAVAGNWSYFHNWQSWAGGTPVVGGKPAVGNPNLCATPAFMEVGARNQSAPPWEGPMTGFGSAMSDSQDAQINSTIQKQILAMRPYGATPIAGMLDDANEFLFHDTTSVPHSSPAVDFGPYEDPYWLAGCRKTYQILLTDGNPNLDLRGVNGSCDVTPSGTPPGNCPYPTPVTTLTNMRLSPPTGNQSVITFVVGIAVSNPAALAAKGYTSCSQLNPVTDCASPPASLQACCNLQQLAVAGGGAGATAYFADNPGQLKQALSSILSSLIGTTTARTTPVYTAAGAPGAQGNAFSSAPASSYHFAASFNVTSPPATAPITSGGSAGPWSGNLVRERWVCQSGVPTPQTPLVSAGDNFAANIDQVDNQHPRQFFTVIGATATVGTQVNQVFSDWTIRPYVATDDGFGTYQPSTNTPTTLIPFSSFPTQMALFPAAFAIQTPTDSNCLSAFGIGSPASQCVNYLMNWEIGGDNTGLAPAFQPVVSRDYLSPYCTENPAAKCSKLGAIYHSTPAVIGPPREFLRDDTYIAYANNPNVLNKPIMLYTASIDGQLHAFKVSESVSPGTFTTDSQVNNELWSFFPPAVLQHILPNFNSGGANILDGAPVVVDVPATVVPTGAAPLFERTPTSNVGWRRVLIAGGGQAGGFYYALDVTDPTVAPQFLWQISTDGLGHPMFGAITPTPAVAIVPIMEGGVRTQVAVAILPGGAGILSNTCTNPPPFPPHLAITPNDPNNPSNPGGSPFNLSSFNAPRLRCWNGGGDDTWSWTNNNPAGHFGSGGAATGNSITVVRLDNGKVLAHFTGANYYGAVGGGLQPDPGTSTTGGNYGNLFSTQPFYAPMTGIPTVYPADVGAVADRAYIGDADGELWRIDFSYPNPNQWTVSLAWDAYLDASTSVRDGIQLAPVLSRDPIGNLNIMIATGDQNLLTAQSSNERVWSLTETPLNHATSQNWVVKFAPSQGHVTGPMEVFNNVLYFSTYQPLVTTVCSNGVANVWGVDSRRPSGATGSPLPMFGTPPALFGPGTTDGSVIMGVSVAETPSCSSSQTTQDPYFGGHTQVSGVGQSQYHVMWQTGAGSGITPNATVANEMTGTQSMALPPPGQSTRIDSWAAIVE